MDDVIAAAAANVILLSYRYREMICTAMYKYRWYKIEVKHLSPYNSCAFALKKVTGINYKILKTIKKKYLSVTE